MARTATSNRPPTSAGTTALTRLALLFKRCRAATVAGAPPPRQHFPGDRNWFIYNHIFFRKMPDPIFSSALNAFIERVSESQLPLWDEVISEQEQMPADELSRLTVEQRAKVERFERTTAHAQAQWLKLSSNSRQLCAPKSDHYIEFEDSLLVVHSVDETARAVRAWR